MTMEEPFLWCENCKRLYKELENLKRNMVILKQKIVSNEFAIIQNKAKGKETDTQLTGKIQSMSKLLKQMDTQLSQKEKELTVLFQETESLKMANQQFNSVINSLNKEIKELKKDQEIKATVNSQLLTALKVKEEEWEEQKTTIKHYRIKESRAKAKSAKDNDTEQKKMIVCSSLKVAHFFAQALEKLDLIPSRSKGKLSSLFKNPESTLEFLRTNFNGSAKVFQDIFTIINKKRPTNNRKKQNNRKQESDDSFDEDKSEDEDGALLQELLAAEKDISSISSPKTPDKHVMNSPQKTPTKKSPQKSPFRNSPKITPLRKSPRTSYSSTSPRKKSPKKSLQKSPKKIPSQDTFELEKKLRETSSQEATSKLDNNFVKRSFLTQKEYYVEKTVDKRTNESSQKTIEQNMTSTSHENLSSLLVNDLPLCEITNSNILQNAEENNLKKRRKETKEEKIDKILKIMILQERPLSPLPNEFESSVEDCLEDICKNVENRLLESLSQVVVKNRSKFKPNLRSKRSIKIRPVPKVYGHNTRCEFGENTKSDLGKAKDCLEEACIKTMNDSLIQMTDEAILCEENNNVSSNLVKSCLDIRSNEMMEDEENNIHETCLNLENNENDYISKLIGDSLHNSSEMNRINKSVECKNSTDNSINDENNFEDSLEGKEIYLNGYSIKPSETSHLAVDLEELEFDSNLNETLSHEILTDAIDILQEICNTVCDEDSNTKEYTKISLDSSHFESDEILKTDKVEFTESCNLLVSEDIKMVEDAKDISSPNKEDNFEVPVENISNLIETKDHNYAAVIDYSRVEEVHNLERNSIQNCEHLILESPSEIPICSSHEIITDIKDILDEICISVCAKDDIHHHESFNEVPKAFSETNSSSLVSEDSILILNEEKKSENYNALSNSFQEANDNVIYNYDAASLISEQAENVCFPINEDIDDNESASDCNDLIIDLTYEQSPKLNLCLDKVEFNELANDIESPESPDEFESPDSPPPELETFFSEPKIIPTSPRYQTRSCTSQSQLIFSANSTQDDFSEKSSNENCNFDSPLKNGSRSCSPDNLNISPVVSPISPLPTSPRRSNNVIFVKNYSDATNINSINMEESDKLSNPRSVRRRISMISSPEKSHCQSKKRKGIANCLNDSDTTLTRSKSRKRKLEENEMTNCKIVKREEFIANGINKHRMCTRSSMQINKVEVQNVQKTKALRVQERKTKAQQAQERKTKKNKNKSKSKNRIQRLNKITNIQLSAAEKPQLIIPMHLMLMIKNVVSELKTCRLDLTEKICDNARDRKIPVLTDKEKTLLELVIEKTSKLSKPSKKRVFESLELSLNAAIFNDSKVQSLGRASLCRFYSMICNCSDKLDRIKELCYNLLLNMTDVAGIFITNMMEVLPASGPLYEVIRYVLINHDVGLTSSMKTYILSIFSEFYCTKDCDTYVVDLLLKLRQGNDECTKSMFELEWSVEIISAIKGWSWTKEFLISKHLWPTIKEWEVAAKKLKSNTKENNVIDKSAASIFKIFGLICQKCPTAESGAIISFMKELRLLLQTLNLNLVALSVQEAVIEAVIRLEKFRPDLTRSVLQFWLSTAKHVISPHLQLLIEQTAKKMNMEPVELVEGWT